MRVPTFNLILKKKVVQGSDLEIAKLSDFEGTKTELIGLYLAEFDSRLIYIV